jgi:outer membrane receptor protein involved in Fe transport
MVLATAPALAQTTGSIHGRVLDHEDAALPGVTIVLTGDRIPGSQRTAVSGADGDFQYTALPVGRFTLSASLDGFNPQSIDDLRVTIDGVASVIFRMQPEAFTGEISVTGETPLIDPVSSSVTTSFDSEFIEALPTRNNFYDIMSVAPAMSAPNEGSAAFSGYGGNVTSQQWNIDGLNLASPEGGWLGWNINPEIVAETSLSGFGAGAEYGNTLGNVYNVVTRSGTNSFHGSVAAYFQNDSLVDPNIELENSDLPDYRLYDPAGRYTIDDYQDFRGTIGGPIVRDRLWFFAGVQVRDINVVGPNGVPGLDGSGTTTDRYDLKLTSQLAENHRLDLRGHMAKSEDVPAPDMYTALSNVLVTDADTKMATADYNAVLSDSTLLNVRAGTWNYDRAMDSRTGSDEEWLLDDTYDGPALNLGGPFWFSGREEEYTQADVVLSHFADNFIKGSHEFKFGVQYTEGVGKRTVGNSGFSWRQPPSPAFWWYDYWAFHWEIMPPFIYGADTESTGAFIDDSWRISDRLTLDVGVRYDRQQGKIPDYPRLDADANPTDEIIPGADMIDWTNWAPRLGFAWQLSGDGRSVLRGFYGRFWDGPTSSAWYAPPPGRGNAETFFTYPWQFRTASQPVAPADELLDPNVKNPYTDQFALSFDQQLGNDYAIGVQLVKKDTEDIIGWQIEGDGVYAPFTWIDSFTGEEIELADTVVQPTRRKGNGPGPGSLAPDANYFIDYEGAILTFRKRYTRGWDLMASYTWSRTTGINVRPHENGSLGQGLPGFTADTGSDPNDWYNAEKMLQGDRTHMFRVQSNVDIGWGTRFSGVLNFQSGRPYLRLAQVVTPTGGALTITADNSESLRLPSSTVIDLGLQKTFALGQTVDLDIGLQLLNALNEDAVEYFASWTLYPGEDFVPSYWVNPRRLQVKLKLSF